MSTLKSAAPVTPRFHTKVGTLLTVCGAVVAIAVTVIVLALAGADHTTVATGAGHTTAPIPVTASQLAVASTPQARYLGPRQEQAGLNARTTQTQANGTPVLHWTCAAEKYCLR